MIPPLPNSHSQGKVCERITECASTNDLLRHRATRRALPEGSCVFTLNQTAGRGQRGNSWYHKPNDNLAVSILLNPTFLPAARQARLNKTVAVAARNTISEFTRLPVSCKWPNDILIAGGKVAGILVEVVLKGDFISQAIIGVGVNVNNRNFPRHLSRAVSLRQATGTKIDPEKVLGRLRANLDETYKYLKNGQMELIDEAYHRHLYVKAAYQLYRAKSKTFVAAIEKVDEDGQLVLYRAGHRQAYAHGAIDYYSAKIT